MGGKIHCACTYMYFLRYCTFLRMQGYVSHTTYSECLSVSMPPELQYIHCITITYAVANGYHQNILSNVQ